MFVQVGQRVRQANLVCAYFSRRHNKFDRLHTIQSFLFVQLVLGQAGHRLSNLIELDLLILGIHGRLHLLHLHAAVCLRSQAFGLQHVAPLKYGLLAYLLLPIVAALLRRSPSCG